MKIIYRKKKVLLGFIGYTDDDSEKNYETMDETAVTWEMTKRDALHPINSLHQVEVQFFYGREQTCKVGGEIKTFKTPESRVITLQDFTKFSAEQLEAFLSEEGTKDTDLLVITEYLHKGKGWKYKFTKFSKLGEKTKLEYVCEGKSEVLDFNK